MYPLNDGYKEAVKSFLRQLNSYKSIEVITNGISTQVFGDFDEVMPAYTESLKISLESGVHMSVVTKILNGHFPPDRWDTSQWN